MAKGDNTKVAKIRRHKRVRAKISGTAVRPRLNVFRSNKHIYAQIIDDVSKNTMVSASSIEKDFVYEGTGKEIAAKVGKTVGERALKAGITQVVFDRGGNIFHGRVKELADKARESGLKF